MRRRALAVVLVSVSLATLGAGAVASADSAATAPTFTPALELNDGLSGGEPSIAVDPKNPAYVYVSAPQFVPAVANALLGQTNTSGVGFWRSTDGGATFKPGVDIGSYAGGGDSDVEVNRTNGTVYVADLEAAAAAICTSTDHGATFTSGNAASSGDKCNGVTTNQQGPDNDREWLNAGPGGELYLTYHDFSANVPIVERSTDGGATFAPCGSILDPQGPAGQNYSPANGDLISKPVVGPDGTMYVEITEPPHATTQAVNANLSNLYMAVAQGGCSGGTVFKNYTIYDGSADGAKLSQIFDTLAMDGAGNLYVLAAGRLTSTQATNDLYMFRSADHGQTWSPPIQVNPATSDFRSNAMPAAVGGLGGDQIAIGWFACADSGDPNLCNRWHYDATESTDGGKTFTTPVDLYAGKVIHYGNICTTGIFCGTPADGDNGNGNRNLADFSSATIDPTTGAVMYAFPGDPGNTSGGFATANAWFVRQTGGTLLAQTVGATLPEVPAAVLLPLLALAVLSVTAVLRRRRRSQAA